MSLKKQKKKFLLLIENEINVSSPKMMSTTQFRFVSSVTKKKGWRGKTQKILLETQEKKKKIFQIYKK
uniref:Uncharacterized protein n=1 Tax=Octopus bimaculoides TaxID=37653 RepID=A0A0L8GLE2_OCTBM